MRAYFDSDILIWHLRGNSKASALLRRCKKEPFVELWVSAVQRIEISFFTKNEEEDLTSLFLSQFSTSPITKEIVDRASNLYKKFNAITGMGINDALTSATVMLSGGKLYTQNIKHFPKNIMHVEKGW